MQRLFDRVQKYQARLSRNTKLLNVTGKDTETKCSRKESEAAETNHEGASNHTATNKIEAGTSEQ